MIKKISFAIICTANVRKTDRKLSDVGVVLPQVANENEGA